MTILCVSAELWGSDSDAWSSAQTGQAGEGARRPRAAVHGSMVEAAEDVLRPQAPDAPSRAPAPGCRPATTLAWPALDDDDRLGHRPGCGDSRGLDAPVCLRGLLSAETVERSAERRHPVPGRRRLLRRHQRVDHFAAFHCAGIGRFPVLAVLADGPAVPGQGPAACP